jgi:hypothetical protein
MALDARLRDELQRSMSAMQIDAELHLDDARRRGHRRWVFRRALAGVMVAASVAIVVVAAVRVFDLSAVRRHEPATQPESILGTWRSQITCEEFVRRFEDAGVGDLSARWLVNDRLQPGPIHELASRADLCRGAKQFQRMHVFLPEGNLRTYQGQKLADGCRCYELIDGHTFVVLGSHGEPIMSLEYQIDGDTLTFDAVMPDPCSSVKCRGRYAWALGNYAVSTWHRAA